MSHFHALYLSSSNIWFHALSLEFANLAKTNPGWSYSLSTPGYEASTEQKLWVIDFTDIKTASVSALPLNDPRMLVLVRGINKRLIHKLLTGSRCSLLCVDDPFFAARELVECCCRQKRFLSPFIRQLSLASPDAQVQVSLTETESKVLSFLREGKKSVDISKMLFRSQKTISSHKRNIMRKLGVDSDLAFKQKLKMIEAEEIV
ncbi:LuxR C-terminal-related transcriptional regulator [Enterobacter sp. 22452]|uniref:response regulator transcription factor n=1 Tax=Enterobacter TaxID=547 RepID=UPI003F83D162